MLESLLDMCCFGMTAVDQNGVRGLVRKTMRLVTNAEELVDATAHRCGGGHVHVHLISGRAKHAAVYPSDFCDAMLKCPRFWKLRKDGGLDRRALSLMSVSRSDMCDPVEESLIEESGQYVDDIKGSVLDAKLIREASTDEVKVFIERGVYEVVNKADFPRNAKVIGLRWVDTNKGSEQEPRIRSRLVAQEFNFGGDPSGEMFAPTPPLGATRYLLSCLASRGSQWPGMYRAMLLDFKRAFLYVDVEREIYVKLPSEDPRSGEDKIGILRKAMYGTRDAPAVWQRLVKKVMSELGFVASRTSACVYVHRARGLRVVARVDDFLVTGPKPELVELRRQLHLGYEVDGDMLGLAADEKIEGKFLGRSIRMREFGIEIEGDDKLVKGLLEEYGSGRKSAETPGLPGAAKLEKEEEVEAALMDSSQAARFRRGAAKLNYVAQDRGDVAYASKEMSKHMARPRLGDERMLIRAVEYLRSYPGGSRLIIGSRRRAA